MIKRFIILLLAAFTILELQAQSMEKCGTSYNDAIPVAFSKGKNVLQIFVIRVLAHPIITHVVMFPETERFL